jgi:hypothetical protein
MGRENILYLVAICRMRAITRPTGRVVPLIGTAILKSFLVFRARLF